MNKIRFLSSLPKGAYIDYFINLALFIYAHRRLPVRRFHLADMVFRQKANQRELLNPLRVLTTDKVLMKYFITHVIGNEYVVPTIDVFRLDELYKVVKYDIPVIVKPSHKSGFYQFFDAGEEIDLSTFKEQVRGRYYPEFREVNYKYLEERLIVEPILGNDRNLDDIKIFYFDGRMLLIQVDTDRSTAHKRMLFDSDLTPLHVSTKYPVGQSIKLPANMLEILNVADRIGDQFRGLVRVDCYSIGEEIKVGEITHCPESSLAKVVPIEKERSLEEYIKSRVLNE